MKNKAAVRMSAGWCAGKMEKCSFYFVFFLLKLSAIESIFIVFSRGDWYIFCQRINISLFENLFAKFIINPNTLYVQWEMFKNYVRKRRKINPTWKVKKFSPMKNNLQSASLILLCSIKNVFSLCLLNTRN